jgi:hypothetical protein
MKRTIALLAASSLTVAAVAAPGTGGQGRNSSTLSAQADTGQPNASCEDAGVFPGQSDAAPGGGSPFIQGESVAGSHYAGEQPQNQVNPHSVSQYDVACLNQLLRIGH